MALKKYNDNPEDWFRICESCNEKIIYTNKSAFLQSIKKVNDGKVIKCRSCAASNYKHTEETKEKMRNRVYTDEQRKANGERTRQRYANMTPEERQQVSEIQKRANRKYWDSLTEEERKEVGKKMSERMNNISDEKKQLKAQRISEANKKPESPLHNPETWKLQCSGCENEIKFEKYHRFQNAKSAIKKGKQKYCENCKKERIKCLNTGNPEDWKVNCKTCNNPIYYSSFEVYRTQHKKELECKDCRINRSKDKIPSNRIYSRSPEDWVIKCKHETCNKEIVYTTLGSYQSAMKRIKDDNPPMCYSCASKQKKNTEIWEIERKRKERIKEEKRTTILQYKQFKTSGRRILRREFNIRTMEQWKLLTAERRNELILFVSNNHDILIERYDLEIINARKERAAKRILNSNNKSPVKPFVNVNVIEFIENILNKQYNTLFIHGGSDTGEYRIYDYKNKRLYFADAYCPTLNLWIEFDEKSHFKDNKLKEKCQIRQTEIERILKCSIIRFKILKDGSYLEYFNTLK
jgi:hypothetical protein